MRTGARALRRLLAAPSPFSGQTWRDVGLVFASAGLNLPLLLLLALPWLVPLPLPPALVFVLLVAVVLAASPWLTMLRWEFFRRARGVEFVEPPVPARLTRAGRSVRAVLFQNLEHPATWRQGLYLVVAGPAANLPGLAAGLWWLSALVLGADSVGFTVLTVFWKSVRAGRLEFVLADPYLAAMFVPCLIGMWALPWVVKASLWAEVRLAAALLGPTRAERLAVRVVGLTESRAAVLEAADAERRRIERDLHDGAQQRLVSLAMNLGLARATLTDLPQARQALAEAHQEAKLALAELRDLVRGLHPAVLEDRGLDAALSGIAARSPVPVRLRVEVPERAAAAVEAVAYFIVSEALANVARHAQATEARVEVVREGGRLRLTVADDGIGGADAARGTGLTGLAQRAASVDGGFTLTSPVGGPTRIEVDLPCAL